MPTPPPENPERLARRKIDEMLVAAGWDVQDRAAMNLSAAPGVAVRELQTSAGPADYLLFLGNQLVGVVEAKKAGVTLSSIEAQTRDYAAKAPRPLQVPVRPLPFLYESTGVETWFTTGLDPEPRARRVFSFHRPDTLRDWLDAELDRRLDKPGALAAPTLKGRMRLAPPPNTTGMWPAQIRAVENLEGSFRDGKPRALVQMATGSGKTFTAISSIYRLVKEGGARRVLFLVDRGNLGRQFVRLYLLGSKRYIEGLASGTTFKEISGRRMAEVEVPTPPLDEQHRIVAAIETHFSRLDAAVASMTRAKANVKRARASVLKAAVEGRLVPTEAALARAEGRDYEPASVLLDRILVERKKAWTASGARGKYKEPLKPETGALPTLPEGWCWASMDALLHGPRSSRSARRDVRCSATRSCA